MESGVVWLDILARLQGTGLKVPDDHLGSFLSDYMHIKIWLWGSTLRPFLSLYQFVPFEFLSSRGRYLLSYVREDSKAGSYPAALTSEVGSAAWCEQVCALWRDDSVERSDLVASLLLYDQLGLLVDLLKTDFMRLVDAERERIMEVIACNWHRLAQAVCYEQSLQKTAAELSPLQCLIAWLVEVSTNDDYSKEVRASAIDILRYLPHSPVEP